MRSFLAVMRKEFIHVLRDKRTLRLVIFMPLFQLLLYGYGINTDVKHRGLVYHVQTEDKGPPTPMVLTLIYKGGEILGAKRFHYKDVPEAQDDKGLAKLMEDIHAATMNEVKQGRYSPQDDKTVIEEYLLKSRGTVLTKGAAVGATSLRDGKWHHVAAIFGQPAKKANRPITKLYVDGRLEVYDTPFFSAYMNSLGDIHAWKKDADARGRTSAVVDPAGGERRFTYNANDWLVEARSATGDTATALAAFDKQLADAGLGAAATGNWHEGRSPRMVLSTTKPPSVGMCKSSSTASGSKASSRSICSSPARIWPLVLVSMSETAMPSLAQAARMALALLAIFEGTASPSGVPDVTVLIDAKTLIDGCRHEHSVVDAGLGRFGLPIETIRRWACLGSVTPVVVGADGSTASASS